MTLQALSQTGRIATNAVLSVKMEVKRAPLEERDKKDDFMMIVNLTTWRNLTKERIVNTPPGTVALRVTRKR